MIIHYPQNQSIIIHIYALVVTYPILLKISMDTWCTAIGKFWAVKDRLKPCPKPAQIR